MARGLSNIGGVGRLGLATLREPFVRVLILANGNPPSMELATAAAAQHDLLIATDGAAARCAALGLAPALICGDFDSLDLDAARREFPTAEFVETPDQNLADLEKALLLARERGATEVTLLGAGGGRIDHTLSGIALLFRYHREMSLVIRHDGSTVHALSGTMNAAGSLHLAARPGDTISLVAFSPDNRVTLRGVAWELGNTRLPVGTHGVSNIAREGSVTVVVHEGEVVVCHLFKAP